MASAQMMAMSGQGPDGPSAPSGGGKGPLAEASEAEIDKAIEGMKAEGDLVELGPHGAASRNRQALGLSGKDVQSAHFVPKAVRADWAATTPITL